MRGGERSDEIRRGQVSDGGGHALILDSLLFFLPKKMILNQSY